MNEKIDAHEGPYFDEGEIKVGVINGYPDDSNEDQAGERACHDNAGSSGAAQAGFQDDSGSKCGLKNPADEDERSGDCDELGGLGVSFGKDKTHYDFGCEEKENPNCTHKRESEEPGGSESF